MQHHRVTGVVPQQMALLQTHHLLGEMGFFLNDGLGWHIRMIAGAPCILLPQGCGGIDPIVGRRYHEESSLRDWDPNCKRRIDQRSRTQIRGKLFYIPKANRLEEHSVVIHSHKILGILFFAGSFAVLNATPRLALSQTALSESTAPGSNGAALSVDAGNRGDGSLTLQLSSSVSWLVPTLGTAHGCDFGNSCIPVNIAVQTASLAKGTYTGFVNVNDPNAIDALQSISVTVRVGGGIPDKIDLFTQPKGIASTRIFGVGVDSASASSQNGQGWLSVNAEGTGTFQFDMPLTFRV